MVIFHSYVSLPEGRWWNNDDKKREFEANFDVIAYCWNHDKKLCFFQKNGSLKYIRYSQKAQSLKQTLNWTLRMRADIDWRHLTSCFSGNSLFPKANGTWRTTRTGS